MKTKVLLLSFALLALTLPALSQTMPSGGGGSSGGGNVTGPGSSTSGDFASFADTTGKVLSDSNKSASSFAPAGEVNLVNGSNPTIAAADWAAFAQYTVIASGRTLTIPATSGLSTNGGLAIDANAASVTLTANAADTITWNGSTGSTGGSVTLPQGGIYFISTDGAGKLYVSGRSVQGNGAKLQLSTGSTTTNDCVKFDSNGNTVDAGGGCAGAALSAPAYISGNYYWLKPLQNFDGGSTAVSLTTMYFSPWRQATAVTIQNYGLSIASSAASSHCQAAIYADDATTHRPTGAALATGSTIDTSATGMRQAAISLALTANTNYWFGLMCDSTTLRYGAEGAVDSEPGYNFGATTAAGLRGSTSFYHTQYSLTGQTFGTFPSGPSGLGGWTESGNTTNLTPAFYIQVQ